MCLHIYLALIDVCTVHIAWLHIYLALTDVCTVHIAWLHIYLALIDVCTVHIAEWDSINMQPHPRTDS